MSVEQVQGKVYGCSLLAVKTLFLGNWTTYATQCACSLEKYVLCNNSEDL